LTTPANQPTHDQASPASGRTLQIVRALICLALAAGVLVFGILAVNELTHETTAQAPGRDFGTGHASPPEPKPASHDPLQGLARLNPEQFIPITRANPHPGQIKPFQSAAAFIQPPYRQPTYNGEVWEFCAYRVEDALPSEAFNHYDTQARLLGLAIVQQGPTTNTAPGGIRARWSDGKRTLELTAWPTLGAPPAKPAQPPLRTPTALDWVVKYSYPEPAIE